MRLIIAISMLALTGCAQIDALGVSEGDNAMACLKGSSGGTSGIFNARISGITVELPSTTDTTNWTAEDWKTLAELCD